MSLLFTQGIALSADPNYKVLGAAYPWIARRLLTEQSPELRDTLRSLLYKKGRFQVLPLRCPTGFFLPFSSSLSSFAPFQQRACSLSNCLWPSKRPPVMLSYLVCPCQTPPTPPTAFYLPLVRTSSLTHPCALPVFFSAPHACF